MCEDIQSEGDSRVKETDRKKDRESDIHTAKESQRKIGLDIFY